MVFGLSRKMTVIGIIALFVLLTLGCVVLASTSPSSTPTPTVTATPTVKATATLKATATPTVKATASATATPQPSSGVLSEVYLSLLTDNLKGDGYTVISPFTKTTQGGQTVYVATMSKGGTPFYMTWYPSASYSNALTLQSQKIDQYIAQGYTESSDSTSTLWIGLKLPNQGVGVQIIDAAPLDGVLVFTATM
jgi:hypothetical protein